MKFGIGSFAYRWSVGRPYYRPENPMSVDQLIDRCVAHGVKTVLLCNNIPLHEYTDEQLSAIRARLEKEGMTVETGSRGTDPAYFKQMLEVSKFLGSKVLRIGWDMDRTADADGIAQQVQNGIKTIGSLMPLAHEYGIQVAIENGKLNTVQEVKEIIEGVNDPFFGCALDTCNSTCFITPTETVVRTLAPYAKTVHFKDYVVTLNSRGDVITGVPLGEGYVDFPLMLSILKENGFDGNIFLELYIDRCENHADTVAYEEECVTRSIAYARSALGF